MYNLGSSYAAISRSRISLKLTCGPGDVDSEHAVVVDGLISTQRQRRQRRRNDVLLPLFLDHPAIVLHVCHTPATNYFFVLQYDNNYY